MTKTENLSVDLIKTNAGTQMRAKVDQDVVDTYAELWKAKHEFPPLDVFFDGTDYVLGDGFHRLAGAIEAKRASVPCCVHKGGCRDAILFACGANHEHGLHRSRADKRLAVTTLLDDDDWSKKTQTWIAEQCRVSVGFVKTICAERRPAAPPQKSTMQETPSSTDGGVRSVRPGAGLPRSSGATEGTRERVEGKDGKLYPASKAAPAEGPCPKGGEHELDEDRVCMKCHDPDPELHERIKEQNRIIESFARSIMAAFDQAPSDPWLDEARLNIAKDQIKGACATIRLAKAHDKPCPKCNGAGCKTCRKCGYLPKQSYEMAGGE